jgi:hypothetical protein
MPWKDVRPMSVNRTEARFFGYFLAAQQESTSSAGARPGKSQQQAWIPAFARMTEAE